MICRKNNSRIISLHEASSKVDIYNYYLICHILAFKIVRFVKKPKFDDDARMEGCRNEEFWVN